MQKLESEKEYLETDGLYRVPGDAAKVQKIRVEVDQVRLGQSFKNTYRCTHTVTLICPEQVDGVRQLH